MTRRAHRVGLVLWVILGSTLMAEDLPSLQDVWKRHDEFVLKVIGGQPKPLESGLADQHLFTGKAGRLVRGFDVGRVDAPAILWFAGGPGVCFDVAKLSKDFDDPSRFRHLAVDQPGTGGSQWVDGWKPEDAVDDVAEFLRMRGVKGPVLVTGWSWGSTMALLFAQRHPQWVAAVVAGGIWTNTPAEVGSYLGAHGTREWLPGLSDQFKGLQESGVTACDLFSAVRGGKGGVALAKAYGDAETAQCHEGDSPRQQIPVINLASPSVPVNMDSEQNPSVRFAYIEAEMMCRGQRGQWSLGMRFPDALALAPLILIQGRYDQVCMPETARKVLHAWPGHQKLLVPFDGGHWSFEGPDKATRESCGLMLSEVQEKQLATAHALHFGNDMLLWGAALDLLEGARLIRQGAALRLAKPSL